MCIALFLYDTHPELSLLLAFNRDEYFARPTTPVHFWKEHPTVLASKDDMRGGTWLGITRTGRFAFLTNFREAKMYHSSSSPSRGALITDFLLSTRSPAEYMESLRTGDYLGFNLVVGDLRTRQLWYVCNMDTVAPRQLPSGAYGVSNGMLLEWPKVIKGVLRLKQIMQVDTSAGSPGRSSECNSAAPVVLPCAGVGVPAAAAAVAAGDDAAPPSPRATVTSRHSDTGRAAEAVASANAVHDGRQNDMRSSTAASIPTTSKDMLHPILQPAHDPLEVSTTGRDAPPAARPLPWERLFGQVLGDTARVDDPSQLPYTGWDPDLEHRFSASFIQEFELQGQAYGTRSQTVLAVWRDGHTELQERYRDDDGVWKRVRHEFEMEGQQEARSNC